MRIIERDLKDFMILKCAPDVCQECGTKHDPEYPHNRDSLYYQYKFRQKYGRWPAWQDAMAHCSPDIQRVTKEILRRKGILDDDEGRTD